VAGYREESLLETFHSVLCMLNGNIFENMLLNGQISSIVRRHAPQLARGILGPKCVSLWPLQTNTFPMRICSLHTSLPPVRLKFKIEVVGYAVLFLGLPFTCSFFLREFEIGNFSCRHRAPLFGVFSLAWTLGTISSIEGAQCEA
jgi:hypothetical protein